MFKKLLIANRGEVAARIARTSRRLGIAPVGIASIADMGAKWLDAMDEVVCVGPSAARESYLQRERIVQAALQTHAAAIHPGWGFLAEDPLFAALCEQHAVTFVGPSAVVMSKMGLKSPARAAMKAAGLPVIPGSDGLIADADEAASLARDVGYPVILKADAGGGGRGMRRANDERELRAAFAEAGAEAKSAFGNGALYLEKYLLGGRHIEVQVLGDRFGHAVHLFERECSIQRKHQKLLEESPSPALDAAQRLELGSRAAAATARLGYAGAGTIEFFRAPSGELYFMEMNTRLQVEHPVTEMLCGLDLVELQLRVAANEVLPFSQADVHASGHAIEVRINAEDPERDFRPAPGTLERFEIPTELGPGKVRFDTHLAQGDKISPHYDSSIGKLIAHAPTRELTIQTLLLALRAARIDGVATTIPLQIAVLESPEFRAGTYDTRAIPGWPAR
ncbi:MAG TPA: biotin carboxylase N-terminal domain-containing protein [Planctomycetota bacterium]|nr:biotin carboxylase N-terminal domain-containing protein [Planctomycetota bacterium]